MFYLNFFLYVSRNMESVCLTDVCVCVCVSRPGCGGASPVPPPPPVAVCVSCFTEGAGDGAAAGGLLYVAGYSGGTSRGALRSVHTSLPLTESQFSRSVNRFFCWINKMSLRLNSHEEPAAALQGARHGWHHQPSAHAIGLRCGPAHQVSTFHLMCRKHEHTPEFISTPSCCHKHLSRKQSQQLDHEPV